MKTRITTLTASAVLALGGAALAAGAPALAAGTAHSGGSKSATKAGGKSNARTGRGAAGKALAGPSYTARELKALIAYSNASFAEKQVILAGR